MVVIDASVLIKAYVPEHGSEQASALLTRLAAGELDLLAPELLYPETGNILWKKTLRQELTPAEAREIAEAIAALPLRIEPTRELTALALDIALETGVTVYDALYVALARIYRTSIVTADAKLVERLGGTEWARDVETLHAPPPGI
ncbi:MAG: type II toxin-antitoxin system VapC family toxin [Desulfuromonadales bacterium]|nr:type II toxin-antitoxin system VapC family toxin [Desulfuromonadales bacterium]